MIYTFNKVDPDLDLGGRQLRVVEARKRISVDAALEHKWMRGETGLEEGVPPKLAALDGHVASSNSRSVAQTRSSSRCASACPCAAARPSSRRASAWSLGPPCP